MECVALTTIGREIYPGHEVKIYCITDAEILQDKCSEQRFKIVYVKEGHAIFQNGDRSQIITSPSILCLNHEDNVRLLNAVNIKMDVMYFDPFCYGRYIEYENYEDWKSKLNEDEYFFYPFFERNDNYIGVCPLNVSMGNQISRLIIATEQELTTQKDSFWPCRSRSYFIELLLNVSTAFFGDASNDNILKGEVSEEIICVLDWVHIHYLDKVILEDITKQFHTNKTTLNKKFKAVMGITVMEYIIKLRMQVACSLLKKTYLSVGEIMERSGYRDDAHFLRSFKKYTGCTPTEYRNQFE